MSTKPSPPRRQPDVDDVLAKATKEYEAYIQLAKLADLTKVLTARAATPTAADTPLSLTIWPAR